MRNINAYHFVTLQVVTSGYADRYVQAQESWEIDADGATVQVSDRDVVQVYAALAGVSADEAAARLDACKPTYLAHYMMANAYGGHDRSSVETRAAKLDAGVLYAIGKTEQPPELTTEEWAAIVTGLEDCNHANARWSKPIVSFRVPESIKVR